MCALEVSQIVTRAGNAPRRHDASLHIMGGWRLPLERRGGPTGRRNMLGHAQPHLPSLPCASPSAPSRASRVPGAHLESGAPTCRGALVSPADPVAADTCLGARMRVSARES